jgi:hypothetical protein
MPLQNRVDPFGAIVASPARGLFTGNRGIIHDPETRTMLKRRWSSRAWIVCDLVHPRGRRRVPMGANGPGGRAAWTELFFLDEVTALAAGHRPCFYCRRPAATAFAAAAAQSSGTAAPRMTVLDTQMHRERLASGGQPLPLTEAEVRALPDGAMVALGGRPFAVLRGALLPWSFTGYAPAPPHCRSLPGGAALITPPTTVAALRAGYRPAWHASAGAAAVSPRS